MFHFQRKREMESVLFPIESLFIPFNFSHNLTFSSTRCLSTLDQHVLCAGETIQLYYMAKELIEIKETGHKAEITGCEFYTDSGVFSTCSMDKTIQVWDTNELAPVFKFNMRDPVYRIASQDGLIAAGLKSKMMHLCDLNSGSMTHSLKHSSSTTSLCWYPENKHYIVSGGLEGEIKMWDVRKTNESIWTQQCSGTVKDVKFLNNQIVVSVDNELNILDLDGENQHIVFNNKHSNKADTIQSAVYSTDNARRAVIFMPSDNGRIYIYNSRGQLVRVLQSHLGGISSLCFCPELVVLYSACYLDGVYCWKQVDKVPFIGDTWDS
ncbi:DNA excision repair protein ERCC-8 [Terramyces sp. JEL0728]|nr:DNA excision repair protein ERCC-8 [Terramyces sp. JEL0728]